MKPPCWRTSLVLQYGGQKVVESSGTYFGSLGGMIIRTEPKNIYTSTFPNTLTPKIAKNQEISVYFSANAMLALCHAPP